MVGAYTVCPVPAGTRNVPPFNVTKPSVLLPLAVAGLKVRPVATVMFVPDSRPPVRAERQNPAIDVDSRPRGVDAGWGS